MRRALKAGGYVEDAMSQCKALLSDLRARPWSKSRLIAYPTEICRSCDFEFFNRIGRFRPHPLSGTARRATTPVDRGSHCYALAPARRDARASMISREAERAQRRTS